MAKRKRALKSPPTYQPAKKERLKELQDPAAALEKTLPDQVHSAQDVPQDDPRGPCARDLISISNAVNSPLLRLPAEIRNMIFTYVYDEMAYKADYAFGCIGFVSRPYLKVNHLDYVWKLDSVSLVCRQLHSEMALLPYELGLLYLLNIQKQGIDGLWALERLLGRLSSRQIDATDNVYFSQWSIALRKRWHRTRTAAYWVAKLEDLRTSAAKMDHTQRLNFDISSLGPSDS